MGRYARKKGKGSSCKGIGKRGGKTKTKTRDLDQISEDIMNREEFLKVLDSTGDEKISDLYCVECSRTFQSSEVLDIHLRSKTHKHRVRRLKDYCLPTSLET